MPKTQLVERFVKRVCKTAILVDETTWEDTCVVCSTENIAAVAETVCKQPSASTKNHSQQLNISWTSLNRIIQIGVALKPYSSQNWLKFLQKNYLIQLSKFSPQLVILTSKIITSGACKIHMSSQKSQCIQNKLLFGVEFFLVEFFVLFSFFFFNDEEVQSRNSLAPLWNVKLLVLCWD